MRSVFLLKESPGCQMDGSDPAPGVVVRAVVSKRGVDDGNQKGGDFLQPAKESQK